MAKNFKILHTGVGPWRKDAVVSEQHIHDLQGEITNEKDAARTARYKGEVQRLLDTGAIEETDDDVKLQMLSGQSPPPELTKGDNVDPGSDDDVHKRAQRRKDAVGKGNTGMPGAAAGAAGTEDLNDLTVPELHERAKSAGVEGYSTMHKDELVKAVRKAEKK